MVYRRLILRESNPWHRTSLFCESKAVRSATGHQGNELGWDKWAFNRFWTSLAVLIKVKWWPKQILRSQVTGKGEGAAFRAGQDYCNLKRRLLAQHLLRFRGWGEGTVQHACFGLSLDDILVWSKTFEQELTYLQMVCNTLEVISLKSNPQTSESSRAEVINYECRASQGMVFTATKRMQAGQSWAALQTRQQGLGLVRGSLLLLFQALYLWLR